MDHVEWAMYKIEHEWFLQKIFLCLFV